MNVTAGRMAAATLAVAALAIGGRAAGPAPYRPIDGYGNNAAHPSWGTPGTHLRRGPSGAHYDDGVSAPAEADRPSPRAVSNAVFAQPGPVPNRTGLSDFIWTWGQFVDHDIGLTEGNAEPFPIAIPAGDPEFDPLGKGTYTMPFFRAMFDPLTGQTMPRAQINEITAYIDGSNVYGSDAARADWLRTLTGGRLKVSSSPHGDLLPYNDGTQPNAGSPEVPDLSEDLFVAGDIRSNEQPALTAMHTLFVREHNYQAERIAHEQPGLDDEAIYQRARRLVIAEIQSITYEEFLPALLGGGVVKPSGAYDPGCDPSIAAVFSGAAYRLGHTLLSPVIQRIGEQGSSNPLSLREQFFSATPPLLTEFGLEPYFRGLAVQTAQDLDELVIDDVRNFLFGAPGAGGLDLAAMNIQRGRDLGLPDYNTAREEYGLRRLPDFEALTRRPALAGTLHRLYGSIDRLDLFVGLLVEDDLPGSMMGRLLQTILIDQFSRLRDGDRFFYAREFQGQELAQVRATRLSDVIRRNTGARLQTDVFHVPGRERANSGSGAGAAPETR